MRTFVAPFGLFSILLLAGCSDGRLKTSPVSGEVFVDGKPAEDALIYFHYVDGPKDGPMPTARADKDGKFKVSTYGADDGAPHGDYIVTFEWREKGGFGKTQFNGPDRLKGKYADKAKSTHKVTIEKKDMNALPKFDLKKP